MIRETREELDRVCCELDDLRPRAVITRVAWGECDLARVPQGGSEPHKLVERGSIPRPATNFESHSNLTSGRPVSSAGFPDPHLLGEVGPVSSICPWCALERAMSGQRSVRSGLVRVASCDRHAPEQSSVEVSVCDSPITPAGGLLGHRPFPQEAA